MRAAAPTAFTNTADSIPLILLPFSRTAVASPVVWCLGVCVGWESVDIWCVHVYHLVSCCRAISTGEAGASRPYHIVGSVCSCYNPYLLTYLRALDYYLVVPVYTYSTILASY